MTNFTNELKKLELQTWENGSTWQRARIAYRHNRVCELRTEELQEILDTLADMNFLAEMSDSYKVTCSEKRENNSIAERARVELITRNQPRLTFC